MIDALPAAGELSGMSREEQRAAITGAEAFDSLFAFFNGMVNPLTEQAHDIMQQSVTITADVHGGACPGHLITGGRTHYTDQLLVRFRSILDDTVRLMSKSTPLADRKSIAVEALCTAAQNYHSGYGDLGAYLERRIKLALRTENRQYTEAYAQRSLDQPFSTDSEDGFCLYDTIADTGSDWMNTLDDRLDAEQFCGQLSSHQRDLIRMLQDGFKISEIADILNVGEGDIRHMACEIAQRRRRFDGEA